MASESEFQLESESESESESQLPRNKISKSVIKVVIKAIKVRPNGLAGGGLDDIAPFHHSRIRFLIVSP